MPQAVICISSSKQRSNVTCFYQTVPLLQPPVLLYMKVSTNRGLSEITVVFLDRTCFCKQFHPYFFLLNKIILDEAVISYYLLLFVTGLHSKEFLIGYLSIKNVTIMSRFDATFSLHRRS